MARIRSVKPEFWSDEKLAPLEPIHRLVFLGLISQADDAGRLVDNVRLLDGLLFPESDHSCAASLEVLAKLRRIVRYVSASGQRLIQIVTWDQHQKVKNPSPYTLPGPTTENGSRSGGGSGEALTPLSPIPYPLSPINDQRSTIAEDDPREAPPSPPVEAVTLLGTGGAEALVALRPPGGVLAAMNAIRVSLLYESENDASPDASVKGLSLLERRKVVALALVEMRAGGAKWSSAALSGFVRNLRTAKPNGSAFGNETQRDVERRNEAIRRHSQAAAEQREQDAEESERSTREAWDWFESLTVEAKQSLEAEARAKMTKLGRVPDAVKRGILLGIIAETRKRESAA